jgi:hypothetical protein
MYTNLYRQWRELWEGDLGAGKGISCLRRILTFEANDRFPVKLLYKKEKKVIANSGSFLKNSLYIYSYVYTLFGPLFFPPLCPPSLPGRTCSALLFSNFVEKKTQETIRKA